MLDRMKQAALITRREAQRWRENPRRELQEWGEVAKVGVTYVLPTVLGLVAIAALEVAATARDRLRARSGSMPHHPHP